MIRVLIFGTFDKLHPGHVFVLEEARKRGEVFVVVARDKTVERIKGHLPTQNQEERVAAVQQAAPNATVILGNAENYIVPVQNVAPDLILLGYDQQLPPGVSPEDFPCPVQRLEPFEPEQYKSSLQRSEQDSQSP